MNIIHCGENSSWYECSPKYKLFDKPISSSNTDKIYLITQYFIHNNKERHNEIQSCLKRNLELGVFDKIYLINERKYTKQELGLNDNEMKNIKQHIFGNGERMTYKHCFDLAKQYNLKGYLCIANSDIFFDLSIHNLHKSCLSNSKSIYAQLRFEYNGEKRLSKCKLFGPRADSQDVWIIHTNHIPNKKLLNDTDFMLGKPGCDNAIAMKFYLFGYMIYNQPYDVKTYHFHKTQIRNYGRNDLISPPWLRINPIIHF